MEDEQCIKILDGKPEENKELGSPRHRWEGNIKFDKNK
jgi:hypothetical protein